MYFLRNFIVSCSKYISIPWRVSNLYLWQNLSPYLTHLSKHLLTLSLEWLIGISKLKHQKMSYWYDCAPPKKLFLCYICFYKLLVLSWSFQILWNSPWRIFVAAFIPISFFKNVCSNLVCFKIKINLNPNISQFLHCYHSGPSHQNRSKVIQYIYSLSLHNIDNMLCNL